MRHGVFFLGETKAREDTQTVFECIKFFYAENYIVYLYTHQTRMLLSEVPFPSIK